MAVSPQGAERNAAVKSKHKLAFPILSDHDNAYAKQVGIAHGLPADLQALYAGFGVDLPGVHGVSTWELPMPTRIVLDKTGAVREIAADPDYTRRPEPEALLDVLQNL